MKKLLRLCDMYDYTRKNTMWRLTMLPIALQLYSVRDLMEQDFEGTIRNVKEMGYNGVEIAGFYGRTPVQIKSLLKENALTPVSAHVSYEDMMANPKKTLGDYAEIGCQYIAIPWLAEEYRVGSEKFNEFADNAHMLGTVASEFGMTLLYHNHDFEFKQVDGKYMLDILFDTIPGSLLQTQIDTCWVMVVGENPVTYLRKYAGRAPVIHLKDFMKIGNPMDYYQLPGYADDKDSNNNSEPLFEFRPLGQGLLDISSILDASKDAGVNWIIVEFDFPPEGKTSMQCAKESIEYYRSL